MTNATTAHITQVGRVIVPVSDQDRALEFYRDVLGFEVRGDTVYGEGERWLEVAPPGGSTSLAIVPPRQGQPAGVETRVALGTKDVEAEYEYLRGKGVDVDAELMGGEGPVPRMFCFRDPDGNNFLLVEDDPGAQPGT
jgi:catechol 2,3-dioxygenase-like lactoylglutathione lyase family enzyme